MDLVTDVTTWKLIVIPLIAGAVGWFTNWLAVWMTFYPMRFVGIPPWLGWQGILPSKSEKMARVVARTSLLKMGTMGEYRDQIDREQFRPLTNLVTADHVQEAVTRVLDRQGSKAWNDMPRDIRFMVYARVHAQIPTILMSFLDRAMEHIEDLLDVETLSVESVRRDPTLVNRVFQQAGAVEFRFIILSGLWIGMLLGLAVSATWSVVPAWWVLPAGGFLIGYLTNWIALNIVFRPLNPVQIGPFRMQGIFLRRQKEVAAAWSSLVSGEVLSPASILRVALHDPVNKEAFEARTSDLETAILEALEKDRQLIHGFLGIEDIGPLAASATEEVVQLLRELAEHPSLARMPNPGIESLMRERMSAMTPEEFQGVLRPAFQEEEYKLILLGAVLGMAAGFIQALLF